MRHRSRDIVEKGIGSAVEFIDACIEDAWTLKVSDIHIDPWREKVVVRLRQDGVLSELCTYSLAFHAEIIARLKIMSNLRLDEHFTPQDGRMRVKIATEDIDARIVITPSYFGEAAVLRLLRGYAGNTTLETLGFALEDARNIERIVNSGDGLFIVAGPTGSGKTTTLYALLSKIVSDNHSIVTIEDPIEYVISGVRQIAVSARTDFRFAEGLRSILRQDPDVIVVGEIRDAETAQIAISAALTGHKVFATIHTSSAEGVRTRFMDMGIDAYMIDSTLRLSIAQRLVRLLCPACAYERTIVEVERLFIEKYDLSPTKIYSAWSNTGCEACLGRGYRGRIAVYESRGRESVSRSYIADGIAKAREGKVSLEEIMSLSYL